MTAQECFDKLGFVPLLSSYEYYDGEVIDILSVTDGMTVQGFTGKAVVRKELTEEEERQAAVVLGIPYSLRRKGFKVYAVVAE